MIEAVKQDIHTAAQQPVAKKTVKAKNKQQFSQLLDALKRESAQDSAAQKAAHPSLSTRLPGEYLSSFEIINPTAAQHTGNTTIDKTSELYQQALELESYFVKIMLDSMRSTLGKNSLTGKDSFAGKMYDDMMYEELSRTMTKNAGLGLADQIYLQLNQQG